MTDIDDLTPEEIAEGLREFLLFMEECDSQECIYTHKALMEGSFVLYDFRDQGG